MLVDNCRVGVSKHGVPNIIASKCIYQYNNNDDGDDDDGDDNNNDNDNSNDNNSSQNNDNNDNNDNDSDTNNDNNSNNNNEYPSWVIIWIRYIWLWSRMIHSLIWLNKDYEYPYSVEYE